MVYSDPPLLQHSPIPPEVVVNEALLLQLFHGSIDQRVAGSPCQPPHQPVFVVGPRKLKAHRVAHHGLKVLHL